MAQGDGGIRISDAERDEAVSALGAHMSTGRIDVSEYEERCGLAAAARTRADLETLFRDLPAPHPDLSSATPPVDLVRRTGQLVSRPAGKDVDRGRGQCQRRRHEAGPARRVRTVGPPV
ncbi:DUF1707 SHOCT-like domain-containing protein [Kibdelosporangium phytohabitans]|uniref:DUF1707 domain-containing protein n=1 Tax=Kibdelosporangium phytohabitans TaxID=860235 RepID=A0A0N9I007_9PSEU|nr:DUF1707 domain-containing protein [Kibdelosporangium phytohabitans]ALG08994.1 hypothetical protein AOZ06_20595 [Kibdelosporangium phytohabitans]MBE1469829.1 hypothetical protein [Kibdelosporangium phytohabitans]